MTEYRYTMKNPLSSKQISRFGFARPAALVLALVLLFSPLCAAETADAAAPERAEGAQLRVMSYNIMHPDWSRVPVKGRDEIVADILRACMPDVAAIQEAGAKWHKALIPLLMDSGLYAPACRQSNADGYIYCTTTFLYNPRTLCLEEEYILDLERKNATRVLAVAVFESLRDGTRFVAANTHPAPREDADKYERNMADLASFILDLTRKYDGLPVIVMGDFNTPVQSEMYARFLRETGLSDARYEADTLVRNCSTYIGYPSVPDEEDTSACIDHIFVSSGVGVRLFETVVGHRVQDASDHLPILADISLSLFTGRAK